MITNNRVLVFSRNQETLRFLREQLIADGEYSATYASDAPEALAAFKQDQYDLVLMGVDDWDADCEQLLKGLRAVDPDCTPLIVSESGDYDLTEKTVGLGIYDYLSKPLSKERLLFVLRKAGERHALLVSHRRLVAILKEQNISLQKQNLLLARRIEESARNLSRLYEDLRSVYMRTIRVLAQAIDARDHYTHSHSMNVAKIAVAISQQLGLSVKEVELIREASELHDLGKIGIEDNILGKPSGLTPEEWKQVRLHPELGAQILEPLTFLADVTELIRQHHEHFDGSGYPGGKKKEEILLGARIIHLADAYEAMTAARSYRKVPLSKEQALEEIRRNSSTQFDPSIVEAFMKVVGEI